MTPGSKRTSRRPRARRLVVRAALALIAVAVLLFVAVQAQVHWFARDRIADGVADAPERRVAVVFGASVWGRRLSPTLQHRVDAAVDLYLAGRVSRILVSGDNSSEHYNESDAMRRWVLARGIPEEDVISDFAGFSTYETLYRARELFGVRRPILVSQRYHLPRALYIARRLGLDAVALAAPSPGRLAGSDGVMRVRESLASLKAFVQVEITRPPPTYLGPVEADLEAGRPVSAPGETEVAEDQGASGGAAPVEPPRGE